MRRAAIGNSGGAGFASDRSISRETMGAECTTPPRAPPKSRRATNTQNRGFPYVDFFLTGSRWAWQGPFMN